MSVCHSHNITTEQPHTEGCYGVRISLYADDPFRRLVGDQWEKTHWYMTAVERDAGLADLSHRHLYSRASDQPRMKFQAIER